MPTGTEKEPAYPIKELKIPVPVVHLLKQQYWTTATYPPEKNKIAKVELVYKTSNYHKYFAPYYCFFISNGETLQNDLMLYSTFYVSAIEDEYLK